MDLTKRAAFGWPASGGASANPRKGLVVHYDGSDQGLAGKPHSACVTYWKNTRKFHMGPSRGWADIGYSYFACPHGRVLEGRGLNREQAAQPGGNRDYYSVTLGSGPSEQPTTAQINAVRELRAWLMNRGVAGTMKGHRDFFATACPGDRAYRLVTDGTFTRAPDGDDMPLSKADLENIRKYVWDTDTCPAPSSSSTVKTNPTWVHRNVLREMYDRVTEGNAALLKLASQYADVDEAEIARLVLAQLTPAAIAAAIPAELADQVVDALADRLEA